MAEHWITEFAEEIADDDRALKDARSQRANNSWSYDVAVERTRQFYRDRITGYCNCGSVTIAEQDRLLQMVEALGGGI